MTKEDAGKYAKKMLCHIYRDDSNQYVAVYNAYEQLQDGNPGMMVQYLEEIKSFTEDLIKAIQQDEEENSKEENQHDAEVLGKR